MTDSGALTIAGGAKFITGVDGSDIILDSSANAFSGSVTFQADAGNETFGNITFVDSGGVNIDSSPSTGTTVDVTELSAELLRFVLEPVVLVLMIQEPVFIQTGQ